MTYSIEGKFYPLQDEEFMKSRRELTTAQRDIFYHLKIRNPFGDCFTRTNIRDIAEQLELSRRTVSDALKVLDRLGWIELELVTAEILVCPRASNKSSDEGGSENTWGSKFPSVDSKNTYGSKFPSVDSKNTYGSKFPCVENAPQEVENAPQEVENAPQEVENAPQQGQLEPLSGIGFKIPQTNKTNKTNKISLSEDKSEEREKFMKFAMSRVDQPVDSKNTYGSKFPCVENAPQEVENAPQEVENAPQQGQLEPLSGIGFKIPQTNKTNKTNKISLSEDKSEEREKFMKFAMSRVDQPVDSKNTYGSKFPCVENAPQEVENAPQEVENAPQEVENAPQQGQLEPLSGIGFKIPQTNKTNKTNKISLSEDKSEEREKFMKFAMSRVDQLPKRPQLPKKWINKNHDELWAEYEELERQREANEERIRKSIEKPQDTDLDPIIAAGLASGEILKLDPLYKGLWDAQNVWHHQHEWIEAEKQRLAES